MSEKFTASNGQTVEIVDGDLMVGNPKLALSPIGVVAMREFFLHERDQELGRWRSSADPLFVGHATINGRVKLVNEATGSHDFYSRRQAGNFPTDEFSAIAEEYFEAHPLPKPWHDAKPGEVWALTVDGKEDAFKLHGDLFRTGNLHDIEKTDRHITAGRRIWPEAVES